MGSGANYVHQEQSFPLLAVNNPHSTPVTVDVLVEGKPLSIVVDTGAAVSLLPESVFKDLFPDTDLQPSDMVLRTYTGESISVCGECCVNVVYGNQAPCNLGLVVVRGRGPSLFGRNWLRDIRLDWPQIFSVRCNTETTLAALLKQYEDVFAPGLGTIKNCTADLCVKESAKPVFCKARSVPLSLKAAVEETLEHLENFGALEKVCYSDWATPVPKKDGSVRLCGDYKVPVNPSLEVEQYPLPKPDEVFATLAGGKKFSTLDLAPAYNQLPLTESSSGLCVCPLASLQLPQFFSVPWTRSYKAYRWSDVLH